MKLGQSGPKIEVEKPGGSMVMLDVREIIRITDDVIEDERLQHPEDYPDGKVLIVKTFPIIREYLADKCGVSPESIEDSDCETLYSEALNKYTEHKKKLFLYTGDEPGSPTGLDSTHSISASGS